MKDHAANCLILASSPPTTVDWPTMWHETERTRCSEIGPLKFYIKTTVTLTQNTLNDYVKIFIPKAFVKNPGQMSAEWILFDFASSWVYDNTDVTNHILTVRAPKTKDILMNT